MPADQPTERSPRRRLSPEQRIPEILAAVLRVFSDKGFTAARMDDIAAAAGLSKGGLYNHFASKEDVFLALLEGHGRDAHVNLPVLQPDTQVSVDWLLEKVIDQVYLAFMQEDGVRLIRLMLNEGIRFPQFVDYWHEILSGPFISLLDSAVTQGVRQGLLRDCEMSRTPALIMAPVLMFLHERLLYGMTGQPHIKMDHQQLHKQLLRECLTPVA